MKVLQITSLIAALALVVAGCSSDAPEDNRRRGSTDAEAKKDDDDSKKDDKKTSDKKKDDMHEGVDDNDIDPDAPTTAVDQALVNRILSLDPLEQGHFMETVASSPRAFHPTRDQGDWGAFGVTWASDNPTVSQSGGFDLEFTAPDGVKLECRVGDSDWSSCTDSVEVPRSAGEGYEEAHVRSKDSGLLVASFRFRIDTQAPNLFFVEDVASGMTRLMANEVLGSMTCLDGQTEVDCEAGFDAATVAGALTVTASDVAGNEASASLVP